MATDLEQQQQQSKHWFLQSLKCRQLVEIDFSWTCAEMKRKNARLCTAACGARIHDTLLLVLLVLVLSLSFTGVIRPRGAGFYCDDLSITHQFKGDTVTTTQLLLGVFIGPLLFFFPVELVHILNVEEKLPHLKNVKKLFCAVWKRWRILLVGALVTLAITEIAKGIVSEPRPHFWDTCKPNVTQDQCKKGYITEFNCTSGVNIHRIRDAQKSFPSGHSSLSVFASGFMLWYFHCFATWRRSFMLVPCLQFIWVAFALVSSLTRITDRRHHWWDVLAGASLGVFICFLITQGQRRRVTKFQAAENSDVHQSYSAKSKVSRLLSTTSTTCTSIAEDREMEHVKQDP